MKKLDKVDGHQEELREKHEMLEEKRDKAVERLVETKLMEDPIDDMDRLGKVIG